MNWRETLVVVAICTIYAILVGSVALMIQFVVMSS